MQVSIYPNPVNGGTNHLTLDLKLTKTMKLGIEVRDMQGHRLSYAEKTFSSGEQQYPLTQILQGKAAGPYLVKIYSENGVEMYKIMKR